jgi:intein/homing endonuclease
MKNIEQLVYLAGLIDGEGCISIGVRRDHKGHRLSLQITNTSRWVLEWIKLLFEGCLNYSRRTKGKDIWQWCVVGQKACSILDAVRPYLKIRHKQADIAISFYGLQKERKVCRDKQLGNINFEKRINLLQQLTALNKRGKV